MTIRIIATLLIFLVSTIVFAQDKLSKGKSAYENGNWDEALTQFQEALIDDPENPVLHFNVGSALYRKEKFQEAFNAFQKSAATEDIALQQSAYYNQGNALYRLSKYQEAVAAYKQALELNPDDVDAKHNLELVRARLKEMADKQQQEQQQQQQQEQITPSEYAKQLKAEAERLVAMRRYREAYDLMSQGLNTDETVAAFQSFIDRIKTVVDIEDAP